MKKKIINGILMVALVAATSTSFVSCKDNSEDVKTELIAELTKQATNLEMKWTAADAALNSAIQAQLANKADQSDLDAFKQAVADGYVTKAEFNPFKDKVTEDIADLYSKLTDETNPESAASKINAINEALEDQAGDIEDLQDQIDDINDTLDELQEQIDEIVDALKNMVTSVTVNATSTSILANSKIIPGINMQFLGAAFGQAEGNGEFPSAKEGDYVKNHGVALDAADVKGADQITWNDKDYLPIAKGGKAAAGTVYFTVNPSNVNVKNLGKLELVNSQDNASFVTIDKENAAPSQEVLTWGITRAEYPTTLWEAPAIINLKDKDLATIDPTQIIDFKAIASDVRSLMSELKQDAINANRSNYEATAKSATKTIVKNAGQIVAEVLQAKVPALPALALKAEWNDVVGTRSVLSDYSIAATAYKPLSFTFGNDLIDGRYVSLDRLDNAFARIINKLKSKIPADFAPINISIDLSTVTATKTTTVYTIIETDAGSQIKNIKISTTLPVPNDGVMPAALGPDKTYYTAGDVTVDLSATIEDIQTAVNAGINLDQINSMINEVNKLMAEAKSYADRSKSFEQRVSNFLEKELNRVISKVATDGFTRVLEPIILFQINDNYAVSRFFNGTTLPAGKVDLIPTTMTYELLAPAYKKYVAVKKADGSFAFQKVLTKGDKDFNKVTVDLAAGNYTVIYSALDFSGKQIAKKYDVVVK
jgi:hypothetical protein